MRLIGVLFIVLAAAGVGNGLANASNASEARANSRPVVVEEIVYREKEVVREVHVLTPECRALVDAAAVAIDAAAELSTAKGAVGPIISDAKKAIMLEDSAGLSRATRDMLYVEGDLNAAFRKTGEYLASSEQLQESCTNSY